MALTRLQQLCLRAETVEGTFADPFSSTYAKYLAVDPSLTFDVETYERSVARESFTPLAPLAGAVLGSASFSLEATARGTTYSTPPSFDLPLLACGFRKQTLKRFTIGAITIGSPAAFQHGEQLIQTGSLATCTVVGTTYNGQTTLWITQEDGLGTGTLTGTGVLTGQTSASVATPSAISSDTALGYWPWSVPLYTLTLSASTALTAGTILRGDTSGAIAAVYYTATSATQLVRRIQGTFTDGETLNTAAYTLAGSGAFVQKSNISPTISVGVSKDGVRESLSGCRGTVSISGNIGEPILFAFNFSGVKNAVTDAGSITGVTYTDRTPPVLLGATMTAGDSGDLTLSAQRSFCASAFSFDMANDIQYRRCMTAATGIDGIYINGRAPAGTIDPEQSPESDFAWMAAYFATGNVRMDITAGTGADKFRMKAHNMAVTGVGQGDRNGVIIRDIGFSLHSGSSSSVAGDNEFCIIYDPTV